MLKQVAIWSADLSDEERETLEIDLSPREYVIDYLAKSFPVRLMAVFTDENGNPRSEPMSDEQGAPVLCRSALAARDRNDLAQSARRKPKTSPPEGGVPASAEELPAGVPPLLVWEV